MKPLHDPGPLHVEERRGPPANPFPLLPSPPMPTPPRPITTFVALLPAAMAMHCAASTHNKPSVVVPAQPAPLPPPTAQQSNTPATVLSGASSVRLHRLGPALLVSAQEEPGDAKGSVFWLAQGDRLVSRPELALPWGPYGELTTITGAWPDAVYLLARGPEDDGFHTLVLRRTPAGWARVDETGQVHGLAWTGAALMGVGRPRGTATETLRTVVGTADFSIPPAVGAQCDSFYTSGGVGFDRLTVHPQSIGAVGGDLFAMGMGCHAGLAIARWQGGARTPEVTHLDEKQLWGMGAGRVFGRAPDRAWFMRSALRPSTETVLLRHEGGRWSKVELPSEDPDLTGADVCPDGVLVAVFDYALYRYGQGEWVPWDIPETCQARDVACLDDGSVWVSCGDSVVRLPGG